MYVYDELSNSFCYGHEINLTIAFLDTWPRVWKKLFVDWRQFYDYLTP
jgi:hypothetical protein